jgi:hypothetical protein
LSIKTHSTASLPGAMRDSRVKRLHNALHRRPVSSGL